MSKVKPYLFILLTVLTVSFIAGCSGSDDDPAPIDPKTLQGTYDIEFFYTDGGGMAVVTTDCDKVAEYGGTTTCNDSLLQTSSVEHKGEVVMVANEDGSLKVQSKVEMYDPTGTNLGFRTAKGLGANYNFTDFNVIPKNAITSKAVNDGENAVKGVHGRNAVSLLVYDEGGDNTSNAAYSTYKFTILSDGIVVNNMTDTSSYVAANVIIRMKRRSDDVITLDPNTPYDSSKTDNFNSEITYPAE